jgi:hypothetical protein
VRTRVCQSHLGIVAGQIDPFRRGGKEGKGAGVGRRTRGLVEEKGEKAQAGERARRQ